MSNTCPAIFQLRLPLDPIVMLTYASWSIHPSIPSPDLPTTSTSNRSQDASGIKPWLIWDHHVWIVQAWNIKKHPWWNDDNMSCIFHVYISIQSIHTQIYVCYIYIFGKNSHVLVYSWSPNGTYFNLYCFRFIQLPVEFLSSPFKNPKNPLVPLWGSFFVHASHGRRPAPKVAADNLPRGAEHVKSLLKTGEYSWYGCFQKYGIPQNGWFIMENPIF